MLAEIIAQARADITSGARRAAASAAFVLTGALFVLFALAGLFVALFFWLVPDHGPTVAALICAAVALVLALLAVLPLAFKRRRPPPPPPPPRNDMLPQFVSLIAKSTPSLAPRHLILTAVLVGVGLILTARGGEKK